MVSGSRIAAAGIAHRVGAGVDRDAPEALAPDAELVEIARRPRGVADRAGDRLRWRGHEPGPEATAAPERVARGRAREHRAAEERVVPEDDVALAAVHRAHRRDQLVHERDLRVGEPGDLGDAERRLHGGRGRGRADDAVDVGRGQPGVAQDADARVERERGRAHLAAVAREAGRRGVGDGHAVLGRIARGDHAVATGREAEHGDRHALAVEPVERHRRADHDVVVRPRRRPCW